MIYVFLAPGFEEIEAITAVDVLRRAELPVQMVGVGGLEIAGSHGVLVRCDITADEIDPSGLQMIVLPGGMPGTLHLEQSEAVQVALDYAEANQLWIGAICAAPSILGHRGMLEGKKAVCFPGFESQLGGAIVTEQAVEEDGMIITGNGPAAAMEFSLRLVEKLLSPAEAKGLADAMQWRKL